MRRLLKPRTWLLRGTGAAEASMVVAVAALVLPLLLFIGASWIAYDDTQRESEERIARTLDRLYTNVRTTFETEYLVAANVRALLEDYPDAEIRANEAKLHERLHRLVDGLPQVEDVWVMDEAGRPLVTAKVFPLPPGLAFADR